MKNIYFGIARSTLLILIVLMLRLFFHSLQLELRILIQNRKKGDIILGYFSQKPFFSKKKALTFLGPSLAMSLLSYAMN